MQPVDVVIIGGGPAGLATALNLIQLEPGWAERVLVLEKQAHPRHKLCGGGLAPLALEHLQRLGLKLDIPYVPVRQLHFAYRRRLIVLRGQPAIVVTRRQRFDEWLARQAKACGVLVAENTPALNLRRTPGGIVIDTPAGSLLAKAVVGADGSRGLVRRWMGLQGPPSRVARLLEVVMPASGEEPEYRSGIARFDFSPARRALQGYYWDFPSVIKGEAYMNRGVYDSRMAAGEAKADLPSILSASLPTRVPDDESLKIEGHPIHWFSPWNPLSGERLLLVGDAAGAEPLFGEGIGVALGQAQVAAHSLQLAFTRGEFSFAGYRRRLLLSPVGRYLLLRWMAAWGLYHICRHEPAMRAVFGLAAALSRLYGGLPTFKGVLAGFPYRS